MKKPTKTTALKIIKKPSLPVPLTHQHTKCSKAKKSTAAYYHCLANTCQGKNITQACTACKKNSLALTKSRQQEILNIKNAWKSITLSLGKLTPKH